MVDFLKNAVKSKAFKELLRVLVALLAGYAGSGCSPLGLGPAVPPAVAVFECQLAAVEAFVPRAVAEDLVMAARAKNFEYVVKHLLALDLKPADIQALAEAFEACSPEAPAEADPEPAVAPAGYLRT